MKLTSVNDAFLQAAFTVKEIIPTIYGVGEHSINRMLNQMHNIGGFGTDTPPNGYEGADGISLDWERCWGVSGSLYLRFDCKFEKQTIGSKKDIKCEIYYPRVELSWSSTSRDIAGAVAAIDLYQSMTRLGALLQCQMEALTIGNIYDNGD